MEIRWFVKYGIIQPVDLVKLLGAKMGVDLHRFVFLDLPCILWWNCTPAIAKGGDAMRCLHWRRSKWLYNHRLPEGIGQVLFVTKNQIFWNLCIYFRCVHFENTSMDVKCCPYPVLQEKSLKEHVWTLTIKLPLKKLPVSTIHLVPAGRTL